MWPTNGKPWTSRGEKLRVPHGVCTSSLTFESARKNWEFATRKLYVFLSSFDSSATLDTLYEDQKIAKLRGILKGLQEENQSTQLLKVESEDMSEQTLGRNRGMSEQNVHK